MKRLNKARVQLKHYGTSPSKLDIEAFRATVTNFFDENTPKIFGIDFSSVSLVDLVTYANKVQAKNCSGSNAKRRY